MSRIETQRAILAAEFLWFGGHLGASKVYDTGTSFSAHPILREREDVDEAVETDTAHRAGEAEPARAGLRSVHYVSTAEGWNVTFDAAE